MTLDEVQLDSRSNDDTGVAAESWQLRDDNDNNKEEEQRPVGLLNIASMWAGLGDRNRGAHSMAPPGEEPHAGSTRKRTTKTRADLLWMVQAAERLPLLDFRPCFFLVAA